MMLMTPKGYDYWLTDKNGKTYIDPQAPEWAKKEYEEYMKQINGVKDEHGNIIRY